MADQLPIILASSSPYRRELLQRTGLSFQCAAPDIDESRHPDESPYQLVKRLAAEKAAALQSQFNHHLIIGSDQVAVPGDPHNPQAAILTKPGNAVNAQAQLEQCSGQRVIFVTGLTVLNSRTNQLDVLVEPFEVGFRQLSSKEIKRYIELEQPFNCAGSFKSEGLGITLFDYLRGDDPSALIGLPLIQLLRLLRSHDVCPLN